MPHAQLTPSSYFDLVETFPLPGCAICNLLVQLADRSLRNLLYERVIDEPTHQAIRARRGLCAAHSQQMTGYLGNSATFAIYYRSAVDEVVHILENMPEEPGPAQVGLSRLLAHKPLGAALADRIAPRAPCLVCKALDEAECRYIEVMANYLDDERLLDTYTQSQGLCLPHFEKSLRACTDPAAIRILLTTQRRIWTQLRDDLEVFIAKVDHRYGWADFGQESDSWVRATQQMPGEARLFGVDPRSQ
jgi:hypothetical protein